VPTSSQAYFVIVPPGGPRARDDDAVGLLGLVLKRGLTARSPRVLTTAYTYQLCGVEDYFYAWPDGREASGFRLEKGAYVLLEGDGEGFFASRVLGARLRLVPAALDPEE